MDLRPVLIDYNAWVRPGNSPERVSVVVVACCACTACASRHAGRNL